MAPSTPARPESALRRLLAFKAYEIEEFADRFFFRPCGALIAYAGRLLHVSPTALTVAGTAIGMVGGAMLYDDRLALAGFALIIVHSIFDSADGQLARLTGQSSEFGRVLDGVAGYLTHAAAFLAMCAGIVHRGGSAWVWGLMVLATLSATAQAQMYDYYRTEFITVALRGEMMRETTGAANAAWAGWLGRLYALAQRWLTGAHQRVLVAVAQRAPRGVVEARTRDLYRRCFYWPVRGWNVCGDNTRFYAIGVAAATHHLAWVFLFLVGPMNAVFLLLRAWQRRADRKFLTSL